MDQGKVDPLELAAMILVVVFIVFAGVAVGIWLQDLWTSVHG